MDGYYVCFNVKYQKAEFVLYTRLNGARSIAFESEKVKVVKTNVEFHFGTLKRYYILLYYIAYYIQKYVGTIIYLRSRHFSERHVSCIHILIKSRPSNMILEVY